MESFTLLTIIVDESLTKTIESEITTLGATGYTSTAVSGKSRYHSRDNPWEGENIKIETIVPETVCLALLNHLQQTYFDRYAIIAFHHSVQIVRSNHFL